MTRCPTPEALDRAFVEPDAEIDRHIARCEACAREKAEQDALMATLDQLPYAPMSTDRSASMRIALAAAARATPQQRSRRWPVAFVAAAAAVAAVVVLLNGTDTRPATEAGAPEARPPVAKVAPLRPEQLERPVRPAPVSAVELRDGSPVFEVPALGVTSIVVRTDDAEIRAERARFQVFAEAGSLVRLQVISGVLELRPPGGGNIALEAGESWTAEPAEVEPAAVAPVEPRRVVERAAPSGSQAQKASATGRTALEDEASRATERTALEDEASSATERAASEADTPSTASEADAPSATTEAPAEASGDKAEPPASPDEAFAYAWRAFRSGDYAAAAHNFEIAAEGDGPFAEDAGYWRAIAELRRGDEERAVELLDAFLEGHPTSARRDEVLRLKDKLLR